MGGGTPPHVKPARICFNFRQIYFKNHLFFTLSASALALASGGFFLVFDRFCVLAFASH